ncbi:hypothetical protein L1887_01390 [Cichorium endivia]|nr:hypothetical protein L1887_01390 [Cichorium endivia]
MKNESFISLLPPSSDSDYKKDDAISGATEGGRGKRRRLMDERWRVGGRRRWEIAQRLRQKAQLLPFDSRHSV